MDTIGFVASSGGHWRELMGLRELSEHYDVFYATEYVTEAMAETDRLYTFRQINRREPRFVPHFAQLFRFTWKVLREERPNVIISTGALFAYPFCLLAKLMGSQVIYIESIARVTELSLTGKLVYPFADQFLVQWDSLSERYPRAIYKGGLM